MYKKAQALSKIGEKKRIIFFIFIFGICTGFFQCATYSQEKKNSINLILGYKSISLEGKLFSHNTHKDDYFLPNANVLGSAGTTEIKRINLFTIGLGYTSKLSKLYSFDFSIGMMVGHSRSVHKNDNDTRHDSDGAFVFSELRPGYFITTSSQYFISNFFIGVQGEWSGVRVESGYDRFSRDEKVETKTVSLFSVGPKVGYRFKRFNIEATLQFGNNVGLGVQSAIFVL